MDSIRQLHEAGQSVWLDFLRRALITSGELQGLVERGWVTGITSNPTILRKAITGSADYDGALRLAAEREPVTPYDAYLALASEDIRLAADVLRPVYESTGGADGFVSFEAQEGTTEEIVAEVKRMHATVARRNIMIKVPGTQPGVDAVAQLISHGININITLLFDVDVYEQFARAYIAGLEHRRLKGQRVDNISSVASFFVSRVDTKVDESLPAGSPLRGNVAVANARLAYQRFLDVFSGPAWERLVEHGARVQRPLWASTGTKNPTYSDVLYVQELVAPNTVNTMPEATMRAFLDHGTVQPFAFADIAEARAIIDQAEAAGCSLADISEQLLSEGLASFKEDLTRLIDEIDQRVRQPSPDRRPLSTGHSGLHDQIQRRLRAMRDEHIIRRIWDRDVSVWGRHDASIPKRLGWLTIAETMLDDSRHLASFAESVHQDACHNLLLLGMGGSSLAPEVLWKSLGVSGDVHDAAVLDTTDPDAIRAFEESHDLSETLFIVSSKSGTTIETASLLNYFLQRQPAGHQYVAITDPGTPLDRVAASTGFRKTFAGASDIGGRYSALSFFGLVPAALAGIDVEDVLERAQEMMLACHYSVPIELNPGACLGAAIGEAALSGRDKLTLILPREMESLAVWIEQLVAESTGKEGKGVVPIADEPLGPPDVYGSDRIFVALGDHEGLEALERAGHPVIRLRYHGKEQLGAEFSRWMFATAVAGHILGINPFDEPNVQEAKEATRSVLAGEAQALPDMPDIATLLSTISPGTYISLQAFLPPSAAVDAELRSIRLRLRDRFKTATTVGYGPRYLHSTGQLHKGGPDSGVFLQLYQEPEHDIPVPGQPYTFGQLRRAQADGDVIALLRHGRAVTRTTLDELHGVLSGTPS